MEKVPANALFQDLLLRFSGTGDAAERKILERELWARFGSTIAVLVVDMSGYTKLARSHGMVHCLAMIRQMQVTVRPIVERHGGRIVKFEADNADACFASPGDAIQASIALNRALQAANANTPSHHHMHVACGIDYGECLIAGPSDFYGTPVIRASKLGEDLGAAGQILVTAEAMERVPATLGLETEPMQVIVGGVEVTAHSVKYR